MILIQKIVLFMHIFFGFTALASGLVPMVAKKGGKIHLVFGKIYVLAMFGVCLSSTLTFIIKPYKDFLTFLFFIGIFSFYLTFTGLRAVQHKNSGYKMVVFDWLVCWVGLTAGVAMIGFSAWYFYQQVYMLGILYLVFGLFTIRLSTMDINNYKKIRIERPEKMHWFFQHMSRILGAYIATFTAFCVVNVHFLPPVVVWLAPGLIGGFGIRSWIRYYQRKYSAP